MRGASAQTLLLEQILQGSSYAPAGKRGTLRSGPGARLHRASELSSAARDADTRPTGLVSIDRLLAGGLPRSGVLELTGRRSSGRYSIGLSALAATTSRGELAALVDLGDHLDPQNAAEAGVDLSRLLWIRPARVKQALGAAEMLLATGFPLVVADLSIHPRGTRFLPDAVWVRLSRCAQSHGASLLLLTPWRLSGIAADAVVSVESVHPRWEGGGRAPHLFAGSSSRATLQKIGRETPGTSVSVRLGVSETISSQLSAISSELSAVGRQPPVSVCHPEERSDEGSRRFHDRDPSLRSG